MSTATELDPEVARQVIRSAIEDELYEGPVPEDDAKAVAEAQGLVEKAEICWAQNVRGPDVEAILRIAAQNFDDADEPPAPQPGMSDEALEDVAQAQRSLEPVEDTTFDETPQTARPDVPAQAGPDIAALAKIEPWEGYGDEKVAEVVDALQFAAAEDPEWVDLATHVWAYETAHRNRKSIISKLNELAEKAKETTGGEVEAAAPQGTGDAEGAAAREADAGGTSSVEGGEGDRQEAADAQPGEADEAVGDQTLPVDEPSEPVPPVVVSEPVEDQPDPLREPLVEEPIVTEPVLEGDLRAADERMGETTDIDVPPVILRSTVYADPVPEPEDDLDELSREIEQMLSRERLHVPPPIDVEPVEMPMDLTTLSDKALQGLHGVFSAYAYRAAYLYMMDEARARLCREAADDFAQALMVEASKIDAETEKPKTMTILEAEVEQDPQVKLWRRRSRKFDAYAQAYRHERDQYQRYVEALSRHETMRHQEWERSGGGRKR